jgi:hypothetical protein
MTAAFGTVGGLRPSLPANLVLICSMAEISVQHSCSVARPGLLTIVIGVSLQGSKMSTHKNGLLASVYVLTVSRICGDKPPLQHVLFAWCLIQHRGLTFTAMEIRVSNTYYKVAREAFNVVEE